MAALVQTYPQHTATVAMLHSRPNSASGMLQSHHNQQYSQGSAQPRNTYNGIQGGGGMGGQTGYRGSVGPVQPYALTGTPSLNQTAQWQPHPGSYRASSTSAVPTLQSFNYSAQGGNRSQYLASASMVNLPTASNMGVSVGGSRDDSALLGTATRRTAAVRPQSALLNGPTLSPTGTSFIPMQGTPAKPSPERYRRPTPRVVDPSVLSQQQMQAQALQNRRNSTVGSVSSSGTEGSQINGSFSAEEAAARRNRRRSLPALSSAEFIPQLLPLTPHDLGRQPPAESSRLEPSSPRSRSAAQELQQPNLSARLVTIGASDGKIMQPPMHSRTGSSDSRASARSNNSRHSSSTNRNANASVPTGNPASLPSVNSAQNLSSPNPDYRQINIPARTSSSDAATTKRTANPSPLSKPVTMDAGADNTSRRPATSGAAVGTTNNGAPQQQQAQAQAAKVESAAMKQLNAINGKQPKSKTSRLRRAFSFGSAAELRKAGGPDVGGVDNHTQNPGPSKLHKDPTPDEMYDAEQERIAAQQEAAGIGSNIYSGGKMYMSSTDNISISSTASSASIMIRKMGRGMKKGGRSLAGLFRPKSIIGVPAADSPLAKESSHTGVSMVTVEAERERVNVNPDPHTQTGGGTGFPRLERNSIDGIGAPSMSERAPSSGTDSTNNRKSIVGSERERAEVLAAVRKGILKRNGSSSPSPKLEGRTAAFDAPPQITDSPSSTAPGTPNDEAQGHRRTGSIAIGNEDYFMSALRLRQDTKSAPGTPQGHKRNATFSPRIIFHDTWPSGEYDRRGDVATCNRLTPMLAQQIKEELNTFKMEMEVHENSKIYTHFF